MTRAELEALAVRVEAEEPSEELDADVLLAVGWPIPHETQRNWSDALSIREYAIRCAAHPAYQPTRSRDAAAAIEPEGWRTWAMWDHGNGVDFTLAHVSLKAIAKGKAKDEPCARTAAAIRAIAMEKADDDVRST